MFDFWIGFCTWTWVIKIRQDNIDDSPLDSQAIQKPLHLHSSLRKGKTRIGMLRVAGEEASLKMVVEIRLAF